jgi:cyclopropane fatty-acyl-phospholipid synthase-like methyltransferase
LTAASTRDLPLAEAAHLKPGSEHYRAYVGPAGQWDFMGATQFRLLTALGLRENHMVLDLGCGSLRAGKFLILYLARGHYCGIEPNGWLVDDAIARELGADLVALKAPRFSTSDTFYAAGFETRFDFIVAQSIFSHTGPEMVHQALSNCGSTLADCGLVVATFIHSSEAPDFVVEALGWTYPGCTTYAPARVLDLAKSAGLSGRALPWYHPRQTWYALARHSDDLPSPEFDSHLSGAVLRDDAFRAS